MQEKIRSSKPDEKLRDQLLQMIEKDNQITIDIVKNVKKEFATKLEPYCLQYHVSLLQFIFNIFIKLKVFKASVNF